MKAISPSRNARAFTVLELLTVIAIIAILAAILLPAISQAKARAKRLACIEQLHQTGIAFSSFAHDHDGKFPMAVPGNAGGSLDFARTPYGTVANSCSYHHFQPLADELRTPRMVVCPADTRIPATNFAALRNENLSYFIGLNAELAKPNSILAGDRNLTNDYYAAVTSTARLEPGAALRWTPELHAFKGNLLFTDGRVEESNNPRVASGGFQAASTVLSLPSLPPTYGPGGPNPVVNSSSPSVGPAGQFASANAEPWLPRSGVATTPQKSANSTPPGIQPAQPVTVPSPVTVGSTNASAWLLPKEQAPDPGFSLFPESVHLIPKALVRKSVWPLWVLLLLLVAGLLTRFKWLGNRD